MRLTTIEIQNYRSLFGDKDNKNHLCLDLAEGMNSIVGPNNVGKSNIFRALAVAFDSNYVFDRRKDIPSFARNAKPTVTLTFEVPAKGRSGPEKTLLARLAEYEKAVNKTARRQFAGESIVKYRVVMEGGKDNVNPLREYFVAAGAGALSLKDDDELLLKAVHQFKKCFRFVYIQSGQSLTSLLEGKFRDILQSVLKEQLATEFTAAESARATYVGEIRTGLLQPLTKRISAELKELVPEISGVQLNPYVGGLEETLTKMGVSVSDAALTDLADKGTGVRGGVLVAMLGHLADEGKRSMLFAVEEPETFLHPAAQECLREDLEAIARKPNVSLVVSTHSPFIVSREASSRIFSLSKEANGRTIVAATANGDAAHAPTLGSLFRGRLVVDVLDRARRIPVAAKAILIVEGYTDQRYLVKAARLLGDDRFLSEVGFIQAGSGVAPGAGGATLAVMQALVARATSDLPVVVILDNDAEGNEAFASLAKISSKTGDWQKGKNLLQYAHAIPNATSVRFAWEAEDLWPNHLLQKFLEGFGDDAMLTEKVLRPNPVGGWHYGLRTEAKVALADFFDAHAEVNDVDHWKRLIELIRSACGLSDPTA